MHHTLLWITTKEKVFSDVLVAPATRAAFLVDVTVLPRLFSVREVFVGRVSEFRPTGVFLVHAVSSALSVDMDVVQIELAKQKHTSKIMCTYLSWFGLHLSVLCLGMADII
jgi:hypothetical protein